MLRNVLFSFLIVFSPASVKAESLSWKGVLCAVTAFTTVVGLAEFGTLFADRSVQRQCNRDTHALMCCTLNATNCEPLYDYTNRHEEFPCPANKIPACFQNGKGYLAIKNSEKSWDIGVGIVSSLILIGGVSFVVLVRSILSDWKYQGGEPS